MDDPTAKSRDVKSDDQRLADLQRRIADARKPPAQPAQSQSAQGMSQGLKLAGEFASAILVGALLGYGIDYLAGSSPWGLMIGLGFGFAAGVTNLVRAARAYSAQHPPGTDLPPNPDEKE